MKKNTDKYLINRNKYKDIKSLDHKGMEEFLTDIFRKGKEKGIEQATKELKSKCTDFDYRVVKEILLEVKGIGEKKAEIIIDALKTDYENYKRAAGGNADEN